MFASFSTALSAMDANSIAVDVVGNNLANLNTPGYKQNVAYFHDLVSASMAAGGTQLGYGVASPLTLRQFTQGAIQASGGTLDAAIQGDGFFMVRAGGAAEFTRAGSFQVDLSGNLLTPTGEHVQGWTASNGVVNTGAPTGDIIVPVGALQVPSATKNFSLDANLNAGAQIGATSSFSTPMQVYDSLGSDHVLTITFQKSDVNKWDYTVTIPGQDLTSGTAGTPSTLTTGTIEFNTDGTLKSPAAGSPITFDISGLASGASDIKGLNWNLYNADGSGRISQYGQSSSPSAASQDGSAAAQLTQVNMANGGQMVASYSNGTQLVVGQLAMASIRNPESLVSAGNNCYIVSAKTAPPAIGLPGTGGRGSIVGSSLESSNVDIAREFTNLIVLQSAYQANAKVVTAVSQLSQATTNLIP